jgi:hypothetical protein
MPDFVVYISYHVEPFLILNVQSVLAIPIALVQVIFALQEESARPVQE